MINESLISRVTFSVGTAGNNIASSVKKQEQENVIQLLEDGVTRNINTGNLYTNGIEVFNANKNGVYQKIRTFLESSPTNTINEANIVNSMAGGIGSSVPSELINLLVDNFGFSKAIYSNALLWGNNDSILESYNQVLYLSDIYDKVDFITCFDNSFSNHNHLGPANVINNDRGFDDINNAIADSLVNTFLNKSERLIDIQKYDSTLKLYIPSTSFSEKRLFDNQSQLFDVSIKHRNDPIYYGNLIYTEHVDRILLFDVSKLNYSNSSMKTCSFIQQKSDNKHYLVSNNSSILEPLERLLFNFNKFFEKGAFLQHYLDTISRDEFLERKEVLLTIIDEYKRL